MPAPPEFGDGGGDVGVVEVLGEIESQHLAHANAHHGVAGKIKVELERVGNDAQPDQRRGGVGKPHERSGGAVRNADDVGPEGTDGVRQQDFFGEAECEQGHAILDLLEVVAAMSHMQLGRHVPVLDDGARDELGEHDDIRAEINDVVLRFYVPAVDVDGIGERLERIEADAQRQGADALDGGKACPQQSVGAAEHKVCVFEIEQHPQAAHKACQQETFAGRLAAVEPFQPQTAEVVEEDESDHDGEKAHLAPAVKHEAAQEQNGIFELCRREIVQRQRDGEEPEQKQDGAENHGVSLLFVVMKKTDAADGTGRRKAAYLPRTLSTALLRSAEHSLEAMTMTTRSLSLLPMTAFSTLDWACANSA